MSVWGYEQFTSRATVCLEGSEGYSKTATDWRAFLQFLFKKRWANSLVPWESPSGIAEVPSIMKENQKETCGCVELRASYRHTVGTARNTASGVGAAQSELPTDCGYCEEHCMGVVAAQSELQTHCGYCEEHCMGVGAADGRKQKGRLGLKTGTTWMFTEVEINMDSKK